MGFELNTQQSKALSLSEHWFKKQHKQIFEISGPAGSGKTSIVQFLIKNMGLKHEEVLFMAYVGKATMALARAGNNAKTIHSTIYRLKEEPKKDENGDAITENGRAVTYMKFVKKPELDPDIKLLVLDEGSMVDEKIGLDILSFGLPVLVLGDLNQLPPVFGSPYFLTNPDVILTQIMRQAENDPIIHLSQMAIRNERIKPGQYGPRCFVIYRDEITDKMLTKSDIVICGRNVTRERLNDHIRREIYGIDKVVPVRGDKLICRKNNWNESIDDVYLINGLIGYVETVHLESYNKKSLMIDFRPEFFEEDKFEHIALDYDYLFMNYADKKNSGRSKYNKFEFGYAITAHLAQGSQYDNVFIYNERMGDRDYYRKWLYTAITRAVGGLILAGGS